MGFLVSHTFDQYFSKQDADWFETGSRTAQVGPKLTAEASFGLPNYEVKGACHHARQPLCVGGPSSDRKPAGAAGTL